jgi:hypothetical protein
MTLFVESLLSLILFYVVGVGIGWLIWGRTVD